MARGGWLNSHEARVVVYFCINIQGGLDVVDENLHQGVKVFVEMGLTYKYRITFMTI